MEDINLTALKEQLTRILSSNEPLLRDREPVVRPFYMRTKWTLEDYCPDGDGIHELCTGYPMLDEYPED